MWPVDTVCCKLLAGQLTLFVTSLIGWPVDTVCCQLLAGQLTLFVTSVIGRNGASGSLHLAVNIVVCSGELRLEAPLDMAGRMPG
jgi:hypothetical protein